MSELYLTGLTSDPEGHSVEEERVKMAKTEIIKSLIPKTSKITYVTKIHKSEKNVGKAKMSKKM